MVGARVGLMADCLVASLVDLWAVSKAGQLDVRPVDWLVDLWVASMASARDEMKVVQKDSR